ncbi:MAG TPA: ATP-binding protein [Polyangiales bacterium]|jgi:signal transduction histidine kinase|nr:ATP-binding protein [Polyangiales bacterium]
MRVPARLSIPRRIFLGFALVLSVSGLVSLVSFVQHERTGDALALLDEGYLPLALTVSEARATHSVISNLLDRVLSERDSTASRSWLTAARKGRPNTLKAARDKIDQIHAMVPWESDGAALVRIRRELRRLESMTAKGEKRYTELYAALDAGDRAQAERILVDVRARERAIETEWRRMWDEIVASIAKTSRRVGAQQSQAINVLWMLGTVALLVGMLVAWWSQRVLSPLPRLQERVEAVARGELSEKLGPTTDDEIGRLAQEFERMVKALLAREESLREAQTRLLQTERLAAIGRMAAHVSHEVRNPLSSIGLNVELLEEELVSAERETKELLGAIRREIERLRGVTEEYLRVARLPNPHLLPEHIGDIVQSALALLEPELARAGVKLDLQVEEDLPLVAMDEAQIRQVLINLVKNAREAMPNGGSLQVAAHRAADGGVELSLRDEGVGMDAEHKERIFDLFYTTKQRGSGLGLPLTQQIVVAHGGQIRCESEPGRGTTFTLLFPAAEARNRTPEAEPPRANPLN